jgi:hypothetical protein
MQCFLPTIRLPNGKKQKNLRKKGDFLFFKQNNGKTGAGLLYARVARDVVYGIWA